MNWWVSGATGSWGQVIVKRLLAQTDTEMVVAYCRGEHRAFALQEGNGFDHRLRCYLGDIRNEQRVINSLRGVDAAIHGAALKRVDVQTYSPMEISSVNIDGTKSVIAGCLACSVQKGFYISSDKAALPTTFYGATKFLAESLWLSANDIGITRMGAARFGNALGSTGSVLRVWEEQIKSGRPVSITDPAMTRFVLTLPQAVTMLLDWMAGMQGGELWLPTMKAASLAGLADAFAGPAYPREFIGNRGHGEKPHETLTEHGPASWSAAKASVDELRRLFQEAGLPQLWRD